MTTEAQNTPKKAKLPPSQLRELLSRDVHVILSACIHQFNTQGDYEEDCFNVDAVISGKGEKARVRYETKVTPAAWSTGRSLEGTDRPLTTAARGNFIPSTHFA